MPPIQSTPATISALPLDITLFFVLSPSKRPTDCTLPLAAARLLLAAARLLQGQPDRCRVRLTDRPQAVLHAPPVCPSVRSPVRPFAHLSARLSALTSIYPLACRPVRLRPPVTRRSVHSLASPVRITLCCDALLPDHPYRLAPPAACARTPDHPYHLAAPTACAHTPTTCTA